MEDVSLIVSTLIGGVVAGLMLHQRNKKVKQAPDGSFRYTTPAFYLYMDGVAVLLFLGLLIFSLIDTGRFEWPQLIFAVFSLTGLLHFLTVYRYLVVVKDNHVDYTDWKGRQQYFELSHVSRVALSRLKSSFIIYTQEGQKIVFHANTKGGADFFRHLLKVVDEPTATEIRKVLKKTNYLKDEKY